MPVGDGLSPGLRLMATSLETTMAPEALVAVVAMVPEVGQAVGVKGGGVGWRAVRLLAAKMGEVVLGGTLAADRPVVDADGTAAESGARRSG